jgi:hypothetical protein
MVAVPGVFIIQYRYEQVFMVQASQYRLAVSPASHLIAQART